VIGNSLDLAWMLSLSDLRAESLEGPWPPLLPSAVPFVLPASLEAFSFSTGVLLVVTLASVGMLLLVVDVLVVHSMAIFLWQFV